MLLSKGQNKWDIFFKFMAFSQCLLTFFHPISHAFSIRIPVIFMMNTSSQLTRMKRKHFYILVHIITDIKSRIILDTNIMIDKRLIVCILFQGLTSLTPTPNDQPQDVRSNLDRLLSDPRFDKNSEQKNDVISWIEVRHKNPYILFIFLQKKFNIK